MPRRPAPVLRARGFAVLVAVLLAPSVVSGHDLWLVAGKYRLDTFETTRAFINSGDAFPQSLSLVGEYRVMAVEIHAPTGVDTVSELRVDGESLTFELTPESAGSHVVALATRPRRVRLKADDFNDYLEENDLDAVLATREELGELDAATVERYTKWAKAFLDVGTLDAPEGAPKWSEPVGHPIEIVPDANPNELRPGETLTVRVLYGEEPLVGATVIGGIAGGPLDEIRTKTDAEGRASVRVPSPGRWFLRTIHMIEAEADPEVQWESFWCTVTFEVTEAP